MKPTSTVADGITKEVMESDRDHISQEAAMGCDADLMMDCRIDGYVFLL
jgi:hypothetical protein